VESFKQQGILSMQPDQLIINEYQPGQGIYPHVDQVKWFEKEIVSVSLGSDVLMEFKHKVSHQQHSVHLPRRSLVLLSGDARYQWTHGITGRAKDKIKGKWVPRERRVSLTFRKVKEEEIKEKEVIQKG